MAGTGMKTCVDCKEEYKPASNVQKRCPGCKEKHKAGKATAAGKKQKPPLATKPLTDTPAVCKSCRELEAIITVFFAARLVRQDQLEKAKEIARELLSIHP